MQSITHTSYLLESKSLKYDHKVKWEHQKDVETYVDKSKTAFLLSLQSDFDNWIPVSFKLAYKTNGIQEDAEMWHLHFCIKNLPFPRC